MTTATVPPSTSPAPQVPTLAGLVDYVAPGERLMLTGVRYDDYEALAEWRDENRLGARLTFDHGSLEIMVIATPHERFRKVLALLIEAWIEETGGRYVSSGQVTHKRDDLERGFEPDECYYIQNYAKVLEIRDIDFSKDPPPDLAIEIEVSRTVLGRLSLYAAFKVPEVWRYDGKRVSVLRLQTDGKYKESSSSVALPTLPIAELTRFLSLAPTTDNATIGRQFRAWVRSLPPTTTPHPTP